MEQSASTDPLWDDPAAAAGFSSAHRNTVVFCGGESTDPPQRMRTTSNPSKAAPLSPRNHSGTVVFSGEASSNSQAEAAILAMSAVSPVLESSVGSTDESAHSTSILSTGTNATDHAYTSESTAHTDHAMPTSSASSPSHNASPDQKQQLPASPKSKPLSPRFFDGNNTIPRTKRRSVMMEADEMDGSGLPVMREHSKTVTYRGEDLSSPAPADIPTAPPVVDSIPTAPPVADTPTEKPYIRSDLKLPPTALDGRRPSGRVMKNAVQAPDIVASKRIKEARTVRIVVISDTHYRHKDLASRIPAGDILIHCGDFSKRLRESEFLEKLDDFNEFLDALPHRYKIFVAGNHEIAFNNHTYQEICNRLTSCYYLQDSSITVDGLKIYGTPWTNTANMGFSANREQLKAKWDQIPSDTDILITHMPPFNIHDLAFQMGAPGTPCSFCGQCHSNFAHWGDPALRAKVASIRPKAHLFGHVHDAHGCTSLDGTLYVNASQDISFKPMYFDYIYEGKGAASGVKVSSPGSAGAEEEDFWNIPIDSRDRGTRVHEATSPVARAQSPPAPKEAKSKKGGKPKGGPVSNESASKDVVSTDAVDGRPPSSCCSVM